MQRSGFTAAAALILGALALFHSTELRAQPEPTQQPEHTQQSEPTPEDVREAGEQFNLGRAAYKEDDFVTAAEHFEKADSLAPNPKVLWLAIDSRQRGGHESRAATLAALATQLYAGDPTFEPAQELLRNALTKFSKLKVECDEACTLMVDTRLVHGRPMEKRFIFLDAGDYRIKAFWDGERSTSESFSASAGQSGHLSFMAPPHAAPLTEPAVDPAPVPDAAPSPAVSVESEQVTGEKPLGPAVFWTGVVLTAGLAGVSIWSGVDAEKNPGAEAVRTLCVNKGADCPEYQEGLRKQTRTNILWGVTAGAGVVTALIGAIWTDWGSPEIPATPVATVKTLPVRPFVWLDDGFGLGAVGRF
jgi:hypothetical protein